MNAPDGSIASFSEKNALEVPAVTTAIDQRGESSGSLHKNAGVDATPETQLSYLSDHALPMSLIDLRNKHGYVNQVIQYCEAAYLTNDKKEIQVSRMRRWANLQLSFMMPS